MSDTERKVGDEERKDGNEERKDGNEERKVGDEEPKVDDTESKIKDEEVRREDTAGSGKNKRFLIMISIAVACGVVIALITIVVVFLLFSEKVDPFRAKLVAKVQQKCKEYTDLACSLQSSSKPRPIVHGTRVPRGMFPHQVFLIIFEQAIPIQCGGSLINEKFVLTAAHCFKNESLITTKAAILGHVDDLRHPLFFKKISRIHLHPNYTGEHFKNDLCLIELEKSLNFTSNIRPLCLNTKLEKHYDRMIIAGWGKTEDGAASEYLRMADVRVDDKANEYCRTLLKEQYDLIQREGICGLNSKGANTGDSGGPLVVKLKSNCENTWEQIGVFSGVGGYYKDNNEVATFFIRVDYFLSWIVSVAWPD